jgi:phage terminase small subunit
MRGRPRKPLQVIQAEGGRIRKDRVNASAPEPPRGPMDSPADLSPAQAVVWRHVIENQAPGVFRPIDTGALRQFCWFYSELLAAQADLRAWEAAPKKPGETRFLRKARNGALVCHQLYGLVKELREQVGKLECLLGLNPVSRERIHAGVQGDLFTGADKGDPWASLDVPGVEKLN